jgi:hypothetical protein
MRTEIKLVAPVGVVGQQCEVLGRVGQMGGGWIEVRLEDSSLPAAPARGAKANRLGPVGRCGSRLVVAVLAR